MIKFKIWTNVGNMVLSIVAALALVITAFNINTTCWYVMNQDTLPEEANKLSKL